MAREIAKHKVLVVGIVMPGDLKRADSRQTQTGNGMETGSRQNRKQLQKQASRPESEKSEKHGASLMHAPLQRALAKCNLDCLAPMATIFSGQLFQAIQPAQGCLFSSTTHISQGSCSLSLALQNERI